MELSYADMSIVLRALVFSAERHADQRRKGLAGDPYINHPIEVAAELWETGGVRDVPAIVAAILHDTVEDTDATFDELEERFGADVRGLVEEVSDDKSLEKAERKRLQVQNAPHKTPRARLVKLADKIANVRDIGRDPPQDWPLERRLDYLDWAARVVDGLRGSNERLERRFDEVLAQARRALRPGEETT